MSHAALHSTRSSRSAVDHRVATARRWAIGVLVLSTVALSAYVAFLVAMVWLFASALSGAFDGESGSVDALAVIRDLAPVLLVGWCTGLAASAALTRGDGLGARTAGVLAGATGTVAGAAVMALTGLL